MNYEVLCMLESDEIRKIEDLTLMKASLTDLALVIAEQNHILKENSDLYQRLITDLKETGKKISEFWNKYIELYGHRLSSNEQMIVNYKTSELLVVPYEYACKLPSKYHNFSDKD